MNTEIEALRVNLDNIDKEILELIEDRFAVCEEIGEIKKSEDFPIEDENRESVVVETRRQISGLDKDFVKDLFELLMQESKKIQEKEDES